ncbi:MAG: GNAT family N-acetyltransferase [Ignavibacteriales bacterium]|nr:GNAT family N-acetyltransferase [Ignavibacteriales bacterium]
MIFSAIESNDLDAISRLQPEGWTDILIDFRFYIQSAYCEPVKLTIENQIAGIGTAICFDKTGWLAHIIVDKNFRNQGIGFAITQKLVEILRNKSVETFSLIATALGRPVYIKAGFRIISEYAFLQRESPWPITPLSENIIPFIDEHLPAIIAMDKNISGEGRSTLLSGFLTSAMVCIENEKVAGYYLPCLKEGPIYAESVTAGLELMKLKYAKCDIAVIPNQNTIALDFLIKNGFQLTNKIGTRMAMGTDLNWMPQNFYGRIGGNLG